MWPTWDKLYSNHLTTMEYGLPSLTVTIVDCFLLSSGSRLHPCIWRSTWKWPSDKDMRWEPPWAGWPWFDHCFEVPPLLWLLVQVFGERHSNGLTTPEINLVAVFESAARQSDMCVTEPMKLNNLKVKESNLVATLKSLSSAKSSMKCCRTGSLPCNVQIFVASSNKILLPHSWM